MTKLNIGSGFGVRVPSTYREYKDLLDLLKDNGVQVKDELFYSPEDYPDSEQSTEWYMQTPGVYNARCWDYWGVVLQGDELVTYLSDSQETYNPLYDSVDDMLQARTKKPEPEVSLNDRIKGFDDFGVTLRCGDQTVTFGDFSQTQLGNKADDPIPELTCLRTLEQVKEALKDDSVTILWGLGENGGLIKPTHLSREVKLMQVADMMQKGVYVAAKK